MALYVKKGNYIWNLETEYQGEITDENEIEYIIGWYFNAKSGEGYKNETVPKRFVEDIEKDELKRRLEGVDRAIARIERWHGRLLLGRDDIVKQTLDTVFRIFDDEVKIKESVGTERGVEANEEGEFPEAVIKRIREREAVR